MKTIVAGLALLLALAACTPTKVSVFPPCDTCNDNNDGGTSQ